MPPSFLVDENGQLVDRTIRSPEIPAPNFETRTVCGRVETVSPLAFVTALAPAVQPAAMISGRVVTPSGVAVRGAVVVLTDSQNVRRIATTSSFGIYSFQNVMTGESYVLGVTSKRYRFAPLLFVLNGSLSNMDFQGLE